MRSNNVVTRLRLTFFLIFLGTLISAFVGGYFLSVLADNEQNTITYSSSSLDYTLELEHRVADIATEVAKLNLVNSVDRIEKLKIFLLHETRSLRSYVDTHPVTKTIAPEKVERFKRLFSDMENSVSEVIPYKLDMAVSDAVIKQNIDDISRVRVAYNDLIEPLTHELFLSLDRLDLTTKNQTLEPLKQQIYSQHKLLEISHLMSMLLDNIESVSHESIQLNRFAVEARLKSNFRAIFQYFPDPSSEISPMIEKLYDLTFGESGTINIISSYVDSKASYRKAYGKMAGIVGSMDLNVGILADSTKNNIEDNSHHFNQVLQRTKLLSIVFALAVLSSILLVSYFVVERQVNRRIRRLTNAVTDIANGDTNRIVNVSGQDEIGTIATALEVFKGNARELHRSNSELEQFAYSASHDLKSPLSAIIYLAKWTLEDGEELSDDSRSKIEMLEKRALRLSQMQTDLLEYATAGKADDSIDSLDLDRMVTELADVLDPIDRFNIQAVTQEHNPLVQITPLRQIILNLINNAVKHHDRDHGEISVEMHLENERLVFSVSDDGPGIPTKYQDKIFELFEKLESRDSVEGSGLGLSLVKKLIHSNEGNISVVSDPDNKRGTTFTFDWPLASAKPTLKLVA